MATDKSVEILRLLLQGNKNGSANTGIKIVKAVTVEPVTFIFEGTKLALGMDVFEIPYDMYPIKKDDRFMSYPILGNGAATRWALLQKINSCNVVLATMQSSNSLVIDGLSKTYTASEIVVPPGLENGNRVSLAPVYDDGKIKYAVLHVY